MSKLEEMKDKYVPVAREPETDDFFEMDKQWLISEIERKDKVLLFYADSEIYKPHGKDEERTDKEYREGNVFTAILNDKGLKAREALNKGECHDRE